MAKLPEQDEDVVQLVETLDEPEEGQQESPERPVEEDTKSKATKVSTMPQKLNSRRLGQFNDGKLKK